MLIFVQFHSVEHKICIFPKILEKLLLQRPLASYTLKNYINVLFQNKCLVVTHEMPDFHGLHKERKYFYRTIFINRAPGI